MYERYLVFRLVSFWAVNRKLKVGFTVVFISRLRYGLGPLQTQGHIHRAADDVAGSDVLPAVDDFLRQMEIRSTNRKTLALSDCLDWLWSSRILHQREHFHSSSSVPGLRALFRQRTASIKVKGTRHWMAWSGWCDSWGFRDAALPDP